MKIVAFNGSPRMKKGVTDLILQKFLEGAQSAGAEVETVYLSKKNIKFCTGCFKCWFVHPGTCIHDDAMVEIRQLIKAADIIVLASPVYFDGFTAQMKQMLDRLISGGLPFIEVRDGRARHPSSGGEKRTRKMLLVSTSGFGENETFDPIIQHMKAIAANFATGEYMGSLIRPLGSALTTMRDENPEGVKTVMDALYQAGVEAATTKEISKPLQDAVATPLISQAEFFQRANKMFQELIEKKETPAL